MFRVGRSRVGRENSLHLAMGTHRPRLSASEASDGVPIPLGAQIFLTFVSLLALASEKCEPNRTTLADLIKRCCLDEVFAPYGNSGQNSGRKIMEMMSRTTVSNAPARAKSKKR